MLIKKLLLHKQPNLKIKKVLTNFFIYILLYSCNSEKNKIVSFEDIQMIIPINWNLTQMKGIDSGVWVITSTNRDTIFIDYGKYSDPFNDVIQVRSFERKKSYDSLRFAYPKNMKFSDNPEIDEAQGLYLNEYFYYDTIGGKKAKLGFPKISGMGRCLLHINNIDGKGNKLSFYIKNVKKSDEKQIFDIFKSVRMFDDASN